jgi:glycine cleavage system protein P-like pyridoxal-binding family
MPDVIIRPTRASDGAQQECEDLARAMTDRGFEPAIESPSEKGGALGSVDVFVEVTDRASEHALHELVNYLTRHGWKKVREAEKQSKQDAPEEKRSHQGARVSSKGSANRVVMIALGDTRTVMERSER